MKIQLLTDDDEVLRTWKSSEINFHRRVSREIIMYEINEALIKYEYEQTIDKINRDCQNG